MRRGGDEQQKERSAEGSSRTDGSKVRENPSPFFSPSLPAFTYIAWANSTRSYPLPLELARTFPWSFRPVGCGARRAGLHALALFCEGRRRGSDGE